MAKQIYIYINTCIIDVKQGFKYVFEPVLIPVWILNAILEETSKSLFEISVI